MRTALITGGAGFFGSLLKKHLLDAGVTCVSIDLQKDDVSHPNLTAIQGDIRNRALLDDVCSCHTFDAVFHCAAILAHAVQDKKFLWSCNVDGTRILAEAAQHWKIPRIIFLSSNCLWGKDFGRLVREEDVPAPVEIYGRSKWEAEKILRGFEKDFHIVTLRCPTIIDQGRLGLLAILFEFIEEGCKVWVVGKGANRYQFIYGLDLIDACIKAAAYEGSATFNIGSDNVHSMREVFASVAARAGTGARVRSLPTGFAILCMRIAYRLGLSPLGPYQYKMIASNFIFDTTKIKAALHWQPTLTNEEMLWEGYRYYLAHHKEVRKNAATLSAHRQPAKMGIIRLLKWIS